MFPIFIHPSRNPSRDRKWTLRGGLEKQRRRMESYRGGRLCTIAPVQAKSWDQGIKEMHLTRWSHVVEGIETDRDIEKNKKSKLTADPRWKLCLSLAASFESNRCRRCKWWQEEKQNWTLRSRLEIRDASTRDLPATYFAAQLLRHQNVGSAEIGLVPIHRSLVWPVMVMQY